MPASVEEIAEDDFVWEITFTDGKKVKVKKEWALRDVHFFQRVDASGFAEQTLAWNPRSLADNIKRASQPAQAWRATAEVKPIPPHFLGELETSIQAYVQPVRSLSVASSSSNSSVSSTSDKHKSKSVQDQSQRFKQVWKVKFLNQFLECPSLKRDLALQKPAAVDLCAILDSVKSLIETYVLLVESDQEVDAAKQKVIILKLQLTANNLWLSRSFPGANQEHVQEAMCAENLFCTKVAGKRPFSGATASTTPSGFQGARASARRGRGRGRAGR